MIYLVIGLTGVVGALLRYHVWLYVHTWWGTSFPLGTLVVNYIGCFVFGWFTTWVARSSAVHPWVTAGFGTGLIGSFTTFSTFSVETVSLFQNNLWAIALLYICLSLWGGLFFAWTGYKMASIQQKKS